MALDNLTPETRIEYFLDKIADGKSGGGASGLVTNVVKQGDDQYLDKTAGEIKAAMNAGAPVYVICDGIDSANEYQIVLILRYQLDLNAAFFDVGAIGEFRAANDSDYPYRITGK